MPENEQVQTPAGWWAVCCDNGELIKWGKDGGTEKPFTCQFDATAQAQWLREQGHENLYVLAVYPDGRMVTFEE
jgi:hypothetical protein